MVLPKAPDSTARLVLKALVVLNRLFGALVPLAFIASFVFAAPIVAYYRSRPTGLDGATLVVGMRWLMVVGFLLFPLLHRLLTNLLAIVETVRAADPFVPENARRLKQIAWLLLGVQVMHLVFGVFARVLSSENARIEWTFSWTGWIAVLLLFVLARVFEQGTRMRQDLEGTV